MDVTARNEHEDEGRKPEAGKGTRTRRKSVFREYAEVIIFAVLLTLVIRTFVFQAFRIPTGSMEDTLLVGDFLFVNKFIYGAEIPFTDIRLPGLRDPERGDILVFKFPKDPSRDFIKRVVGAPGDTLEIVDRKVFINGDAQDEPFVKHTGRIRPRNSPDSRIYPPGMGNNDNYGPVVVPEGHYFMMGDNREQSDDSRYWGFLPEDLIKGKAVIIYLSWDKERKMPRFSRIGDIIR